MNWTIHHLEQLLCGIHGHDFVLRFEPNRLSLQCVNCGHETSGWSMRRALAGRATPTARRARALPLRTGALAGR
jgi:hypothetical protein